MPLSTRSAMFPPIMVNCRCYFLSLHLLTKVGILVLVERERELLGILVFKAVIYLEYVPTLVM